MNAITPDGIVGNTTHAVLNSDLARKKPADQTVDEILAAYEASKPAEPETPSTDTVLQKGMESEEVKKLQERLKELKYLDESVKADKIFGELTEKAVKAFQKINGIEPVDGIAGPMTLKMLYDTEKPPMKKPADKTLDQILATETGGGAAPSTGESTTSSGPSGTSSSAAGTNPGTETTTVSDSTKEETKQEEPKQDQPKQDQSTTTDQVQTLQTQITDTSTLTQPLTLQQNADTQLQTKKADDATKEEPEETKPMEETKRMEETPQAGETKQKEETPQAGENSSKESAPAAAVQADSPKEQTPPSGEGNVPGGEGGTPTGDDPGAGT